jgi:hypothetical protein
MTQQEKLAEVNRLINDLIRNLKEDEILVDAFGKVPSTPLVIKERPVVDWYDSGCVIAWEAS